MNATPRPAPQPRPPAHVRALTTLARHADPTVRAAGDVLVSELARLRRESAAYRIRARDTTEATPCE